ncbi:MAG: type II toxin-antitoxin system RelE/ParE family toxin [Thermoflexaceae bacterium]|nr:type II toxin-antitoxin system RelE/ParE family toxin [Thermoflexaceae bacterium]
MTKEKFSVTPPFPRYQKWLIVSLEKLEEYGEEAIKLNNFEQLTNINPKLYSIRYPKSKLNPRVLYIYLDEGGILLLAAFKEKSKKDYTRNIELAQKRLKMLDI